MGTDKTAFSRKATKQRGQGSKAERFNDARFVNYDLDEEQRKACKAYVITEADLLDRVSTLIADGYRFGVSLDRDGVTYTAYCQLREPGGDNTGLILTGRGSSCFKSLKQLLYKHYVCMDGDWGPYAEHRGDVVIDD
jgi:hypothetical protein